jgi:predicted ATPase
MWQLGYPDQALHHAEAVKKIAEEVSHPLSLAQALCFGATLWEHCRDNKKAWEMAEMLIPLCREHDLALWLAWGMVFRGWSLMEQGQEETGVEELRQGIAQWQATGAEVWLPYFRSLLAKAHGKAGRREEGLQVLTEALAVTSANGEAWFDAELYRLKGELTLQEFQVSSSKFQVLPGTQHMTPNTHSAAEACFQRAFKIARQQSAKSLELRAAMSLGRLWQSQGKNEEAYSLLAPVYAWFTEGFGTKDLQDAKALLDELGGEAGRGQRASSPEPKATVRTPQRGVSTKKKKSRPADG